ncbi:hypothetical protein SAY87_001133 [Trapa incisa]|uniref:Uncharacterized protein n=1 Tax=Trapa incisa TaxID=236973 RepID=A0AAN7GP37_9MYRT|nr:hypothetical protein SAY87_001133 [Trapa incisa]
MEFKQEAHEREFAEFKDLCCVGGGGEAGEDEEETLSFCDLPIYGDEAAKYWDGYEKSEGSFSSLSSSSSSSSLSEDFFRFSSPRKALEPDNIIFCGKLIPYKKDPPSNHEKARTFNGVSAPVEKYVKSAGKVSRAKPPSLSSRWYLLVFGLAKFPGKVEMRDMKKRQNMRKGSSMAPYGSNKCSGAGREIIKGDQIKGKGIWALLRVIGCSGQSANSMVKASLGCVPNI